MQVTEIKRKFRARFWALIHLRKAGFKGSDLFDMYKIFVRPIIEFCSTVYHSLLTLTQSEELERLQKQAVKLAYSWEDSYATLCETHSISTLSQRRKEAVDRLVKKTIQNERIAGWYPIREHMDYNIRGRRIYYETCARTTRYYNSPLSLMRRRANDMLTA